MTGPDHGHNLRGALLSLAAMGLFSTHDVIVKHLAGAFSPVQIVFFSALLSLPAVTVYILRTRTDGSIWPRNPGWVALRTIVASIATLSAFYAFGTLPLAETYAILFATPIVITVLSIPLLGEKVRFRRWCAVLAGLVGVLVVLRPGQASLSAGHLAAIISACMSALSMTIVRRVGKSERPVVLTLYPILGNIVLMGAALPFVWQPIEGGQFGFLAMISALGLIAAVLSILAYRLAEAAIAAPMQYSQILWAVLYGALIFHEYPDRATLIGAAIIIASGLYIVLREARPGTSGHHPVLDSRARS